MGEDLCIEEAAGVLLKQLEAILDHDKLIDEIGFIHPSQFADFTLDLPVVTRPPPPNIYQTSGAAIKNNITDFRCLVYDETVFWYGQHKLAISVHAIPQLYFASRIAYMNARRSYIGAISISKTNGYMNTAIDRVDFDQLETDVLSHSKALLIMSCDFGSVWNSRKLVLLQKHELSVFMEEFHLCTLILSSSPKSEQAWSHRRWVIKNVARKFHDLHDIIEQESELVKKIAEKSKMNYRAWNHQCWLITYMSRDQKLDELLKSRKWAELHVADSCCFHYRRRLILSMLEDSTLRDDEMSSVTPDAFILLKEELKWNVLLIKRYIGREALWIHRRFLSYYWIKLFANPQDVGFPGEDQHKVVTDLDGFIGKEIELLNSCLNLPIVEFEDTQSQAQHAAAYILWISKKIPLPFESNFNDKLEEVGGLKTILMNTSSDKSLIWQSLLD
ncbi:Protein farnesyltransferase/geranylgeranyltransferase type-1 subunit alpha [Apostasia shenzhenica]|uniref:Protein farnesyltransferase/geranylgeranyltransferase type-1 subunit alpha n=1 Tax=Apostasia shenzhenica TaxID=1088818 RepID=A0A2I0A550_9ASPA|nr:Protein farnesyltransferase/geranylgeranyltransferase type-1 subunit alpha [Apostasia shenzhenica]